MELENLYIKDKVKQSSTDEHSGGEPSLKEVSPTNFARTHVPNVFEHQYAEYISGLKPPYSRLGNPYSSHEDEARKEKLSGD